MTLWRCNGCGLDLPPKHFPSSSHRCRICRDKYHTAWRDKNRDKINANARAYLTTIKGRAQSLWQGAKSRAQKKNENFALTRNDVIAGIQPGYCQKTFFKFHFDLLPTEDRKYHMHPLSPSIDKIDCNGIYEPSNVQYVCSWYNLAKGQHSEQQLIEFCRRVVWLDDIKNLSR